MFYTGAYVFPRRFNWIIGCILLGVTFLFSFSGFLLPWDQLSFWAVTTAVNIAASVRELTDLAGITSFFNPGAAVRYVITGGDQVGQETLSRFYVLHVVVLPLVTAILAAVHFWRVRKDGGICRPESTSGKQRFTRREIESSARAEQDDLSMEKPQILTWPTAIWAQAAVALGTLAFVIVLALVWDAPLKEMANPVVPEIRPNRPGFYLEFRSWFPIRR